MPLLPDFDNGKVANQTNRAWDWLFGKFYNREPTFDDTSLATVLGCVMGLIECAESIGSIDHVRDVVDLALMRQDTVLWTSIMGNPIVWIELGRRVRSPSIYTEAAIHLVGQWRTIADEDKAQLNADIRNILQRKADDLAIAKEAIELRILGHYPEFMTRKAIDKPGRPSYSSDIYMWMAVSFFRHWFCQSQSDDRTRRAPDGGLNFYAALCEGGQAYLTHLDFQEFHRYFPMSIKACHVLETNMGVLKEDIKPFVHDLLTERTHLKRADSDITWLTCAKIEKEDLPWTSSQVKNDKDAELQNLYETLRVEGEKAKATSTSTSTNNNATSTPTTATQKKKRAAPGDGGSTSSTTRPRPRKRQRVIEDDDDSAEDESLSDPPIDDEDDGDGIFVPNGRASPMNEEA